MKTMKKILSSFLAIAMVMSLVQPFAFATDPSNPDGFSDSRAKLSMVYMGTTTNTGLDLQNDNPVEATLPDITSLLDDPESGWKEGATDGTIFWVGLKLTDMDRIDETISHDKEKGWTTYDSHFSAYKNEADWLDSGNPYAYMNVGGIDNYRVTIEYASDYIEPAFVNSALMNLAVPPVMKRLDSRFNQYSTTSAIDEGIVSGANREPSPIDDNDHPYRVQMRFSANGSTPADKIYGYTDDIDDKPLYVLVVPFRLKKLPDAGTSVLHAALDSEDFTIVTGTNGTNIWLSQWGNDRYIDKPTGEEATNLKNHIDYMGDLMLVPDDVTITYDANEDNGGSFVDGFNDTTETVKQGATAAKIPDASKVVAPEGKVFSGWAYDPTYDDVDTDYDPEDADAATYEFTDKIPVYADLTVYAQFADGWTINFDPNYESVDTELEADPKLVTIPEEGKLTDAQIPKVGNADGDDFKIPEGYGFAGWYTDDDEDTLYLTADDFEDVELSDDMTFKAKWTSQRTITFYANDATGEDGLGESKEITLSGTQTIAEAGETAPTPTREHYIFKEWNSKRDGTGDEHYTADEINTASGVTGPELYAIWDLDEENLEPEEIVTLTLDANSGYFDGEKSTTTKELKRYINDKVYEEEIPSPTKDAASDKGEYVVEGWYEKPEITNTDKYTFPLTLSEDTDAFAHWTYEGEDAITVKFNAKNTDEPTNPYYAEIVVGPGDSIGNDQMPADPSKGGYTFTKWTEEDNADASAFTGETAVTVNDDSNEKIVYAQYAENNDITFHPNGGQFSDGSETPKTESVSPTAKYAEPSPAPTRENYTFLGWNTKHNGTGEYIKVDDGDNYQTVLAKTDDNTLYAQWAAIDDDEIDKYPDDDPEPDPTKQGVKITFDKNAPASETEATEANPKVKIISLGDSIGEGNMPNDPEGNKYKVTGWNTSPDGTGTPVDEDTVFSEDLDGLEESEEIPGTYEITVYAQWEVDEDNIDPDDVILTVNFYKNQNLGAEGDLLITKTVLKGDKLGYEITYFDDNTDFKGWYKGTYDGTLTFDSPDVKYTKDLEFDDTLVGEDTVIDFFARWNVGLYIEQQTTETEYTGSAVTPLYKVYYATAEGKGEPVSGYDAEDGVDLTQDENFVITYTDDDDAPVDDMINAGNYGIDVQVKPGSSFDSQGMSVEQFDFGYFTVTPANIDVVVDPATQTKNEGEESTLDIALDAPKGEDKEEDIVDYKYYLWTDDTVAPDNKIQDNELSPVETDDDTPDKDAVGRYVVKVELKNDNYVINSVKSKTDGTSVLLYDGTTYPEYAADDIKDWEKIVYDIKIYDPSAEDIIVKGINKDTGKKTTETLYDSKDNIGKEENEKEFNPDNEDQDYFVRVDKDTDKVEITIDPKDDSMEADQITVTVGGQDYPATKNEDGTFTVEIPVTNDGPDLTEIDIHMETSDGEQSADYTIFVQKLREAKIVLNYGNSPVGMIMSDDVKYPDEAAKTAAIEAFSNTRVFSDVTENRSYFVDAWKSYQGFDDGEDYDGDLDPYSIFIFQRKRFRDPGFTAYDSLGNEVADTDVTIELAMTTFGGGVATYDDTIDNAVDAIENQASGSGFLFTKFVEYNIRPDVYRMKYTFKDPVSGERVYAERKAIAISQLGDVQINSYNVVNDNDAADIISHVNSDFSERNEKRNSLYTFRVADVNIDSYKVINDNDAAEIISNLIKGFGQFYNALPEK